MAELADALVLGTSGKPCRFESGSGQRSLSKLGVARQRDVTVR
jgi:hypothetical protein